MFLLEYLIITIIKERFTLCKSIPNVICEGSHKLLEQMLEIIKTTVILKQGGKGEVVPILNYVIKHYNMKKYGGVDV